MSMLSSSLCGSFHSFNSTGEVVAESVQEGSMEGEREGGRESNGGY